MPKVGDKIKLINPLGGSRPYDYIPLGTVMVVTRCVPKHHLFDARYGEHNNVVHYYEDEMGKFYKIISKFNVKVNLRKGKIYE